MANTAASAAENRRVQIRERRADVLIGDTEAGGRTGAAAGDSIGGSIGVSRTDTSESRNATPASRSAGPASRTDTPTSCPQGGPAPH
jgi:hypothetical protein